MSILSTNNIRSHLTWSGASTLVLLAAVLFVSALVAESPTPAPPKTPWPPSDKADRIKVAKAVVQTMKDSTDATAFPGLREDLTHPSSSRTQVQKRLDVTSSGALNLPLESEGVFVFFVPEEPFDDPNSGPPKYVENHYFSIFYLPTPAHPLETGIDELEIFNRHLRCCYQPW